MLSQGNVIGLAVVFIGIVLIGALHLIEILVDRYKAKEKEEKHPKILG